MMRTLRLGQACRTAVLLLAWACQPVAAAAKSNKPMSAVEQLVARDEIRQQIARYALLADGDGIKAKDVDLMAATMMTADVVTEIYRPGSTEPVRMTGRAAVKAPPAVPNDPTVSRHYMVDTYFDALTPTTARTITTAVHFRLTRSQAGTDCKPSSVGACGGIPTKITMSIYHMDWVKTAAGWQIRYNGLRVDD